MLKISLIELLIKGIPEGLISIFAFFVFAKIKSNAKLFFGTSAVFVFSTYLIRFLPILPGVNTILSVFVLIVFAFKVLNVPVINSIKSSLYIAILVLSSEVLGGAVYFILFGKTFIDKLNVLGKLKDANGIARNLTNEQIFNEQFQKSIYGIPSTVILLILVVVVYAIIKIIEKKRIEKNGKIDSQVRK
jgi:hypothetical protein